MSCRDCWRLVNLSNIDLEFETIIGLYCWPILRGANIIPPIYFVVLVFNHLLGISGLKLKSESA